MQRTVTLSPATAFRTAPDPLLSALSFIICAEPPHAPSHIMRPRVLSLRALRWALAWACAMLMLTPHYMWHARTGPTVDSGRAGPGARNRTAWRAPAEAHPPMGGQPYVWGPACLCLHVPCTDRLMQPPPLPPAPREVLDWPCTAGRAGVPPPPLNPPAPQTKVTIAGKNEIFRSENRVGPFLVPKHLADPAF